ncbi:MAG TPA: hypothetical protein VIZ17_15260 [Acetobacteraceae bacterium]
MPVSIRPLLAAAVLLLLLSNGAMAFKYAGSGVASCGEWLQERRDPYGGGGAGQQWVLGFLAGEADATEGKLDPIADTDAEGVWAWIDRYCEQHPTDRLIVAAELFAVTGGRGQ